RKWSGFPAEPRPSFYPDESRRRDATASLKPPFSTARRNRARLQEREKPRRDLPSNPRIGGSFPALLFRVCSGNSSTTRERSPASRPPAGFRRDRDGTRLQTGAADPS